MCYRCYMQFAWLFPINLRFFYHLAKLQSGNELTSLEELDLRLGGKRWFPKWICSFILDTIPHTFRYQTQFLVFSCFFPMDFLEWSSSTGYPHGWGGTTHHERGLAIALVRPSDLPHCPFDDRIQSCDFNKQSGKVGSRQSHFKLEPLHSLNFSLVFFSPALCIHCWSCFHLPFASLQNVLREAFKKKKHRALLCSHGRDWSWERRTGVGGLLCSYRLADTAL